MKMSEQIHEERIMYYMYDEEYSGENFSVTFNRFKHEDGWGEWYIEFSDLDVLNESKLKLVNKALKQVKRETK